MAPRKASPSRSPTRRRASSRAPVVEVEKNETSVVRRLVSPSPPAKRGKLSLSSLSKLRPGNASHGFNVSFGDNHVALSTYALLIFATFALVSSYLGVMVIEQRSIMSKYICPFFQRMILKPLGLAGLKGVSVQCLAVSIYAMVTYLVMTVATVVSIPLSTGQMAEMSTPRRQRGELEGVSHRLHSAQTNCIESLVLLITSIFFATTVGVSEPLITDLVALFVIVRMLYIICYALDLPKGRTAMFMAGLACCARLLTHALFKGPFALK